MTETVRLRDNLPKWYGRWSMNAPSIKFYANVQYEVEPECFNSEVMVKIQNVREESRETVSETDETFESPRVMVTQSHCPEKKFHGPRYARRGETCPSCGYKKEK